MKLFCLAIVVLVLAISGCTPPGLSAAESATSYIPVAAPPAFGSTKALATWPDFLEGRWGLKLVVSDALAKQFGMQSLKEEADKEEISEVFTFRKDGTFDFEAQEHKVVGRWLGSQTGIQLSYEMLDGKPVQQALADAQKDAETGRKGAIANEIFLESFNQSVQKLNSLGLTPDGTGLCSYSPSLLDSNQMVPSSMQLVRLQ